MDHQENFATFPVRTPTLPPATHTNTYIVGKSSMAIVDPASPYPEEQQKLLEFVRGMGRPVQEILLTHHHIDHVSGAQALADALGVPIAAHPLTADRLHGRCRVDRLINDGDLLPYGDNGVRALITPGHAPGHLCFFDPTDKVLVAGDMVASIGTIIIPPSDSGDMGQYLRSLELLRTLGAETLLPAHGPALHGAAVDDKLRFYIAHRLEREARVLAALTTTPQSLGALVPVVYPEVAPQIYPLAEESLLAHLLKLEVEGRAVREGEDWRKT